MIHSVDIKIYETLRSALSGMILGAFLCGGDLGQVAGLVKDAEHASLKFG